MRESDEGETSKRGMMRQGEKLKCCQDQVGNC